MIRLDAPVNLWSDIVDDLLSTPELERAGVAFGGLVKVGKDQRVLLRDWQPVAAGDYIAQLGFHLEVSPLVYARAAQRARQTGEAIVILHSHPRDSETPRFSGSDDAGEKRLIPKIQARARVPIVTAVVSPGGVTLRGRALGGRLTRVELRTVGEPKLPERQFRAQRRYDRQVLALGPTAQTLLGSMTVGVVGVGGLGSHVVQQLAHLGVGHLVVIDDDTVDETNLSRLVGGRASDVAHGLRKTQVSSRLSRLLGGQTVVHRADGSVLDEAEARRLLRCDLVFGCTDTQWSRLVLNALAFQYYVPVIDCGVELQAGSGAIGGRISWLSPGRRCLWCMGILDGERIRAEQLPPALAVEQASHGYIPDLTIPAPAVVSINGVVASVAVTEFLSRITGFAGDDERADLLVYRLADGTLRRIRGAACPECPVCGPAGTFGYGDLAPAPWRPTVIAENQRALGRQ